MRIPLGPVPLVLAAGALSTAIVTSTLTGGLAGFTATISKGSGAGAVAAVGSVVLKETGSNGTTVCTSTDGGTVASNSSSCSTINEFAGASLLVPSDAPTSTTVTLTNTGSAPASLLRLAPGSCSQSGGVAGSATDLCGTLRVKVVLVPASGATTEVYSGTMGGLTAAQSLGPLAAGASTQVRFDVNLPASTTSPNAYQGLTASMPLTWTLSS